MAQEHGASEAKPSWTKIFSAFKVALDLKKLVLAAAGIFCAALGWWAIGVAFYSTRTMPEWKDYDTKPDARPAQWDYFKSKRESWNLLHELAGVYDEKNPVRVDEADVTSSLDEYTLLKEWRESLERLSDPIALKDNKLEFPKLNSATFTIAPMQGGKLDDLKNKKLTVRSLTVLFDPVPVPKDGKDPPRALRGLIIDNIHVTVEGPGLDKLKDYLDTALTVEQISARAVRTNQQKTFAIFAANLVERRPKVAGLLRVCPWSENRGGNPYLIVAQGVKTRGASLVGEGGFLSWFVKDQIPVLLEPLVKFLLPIIYLFDTRAGGLDRLYLLLITVWTLAVWGFFGGAICRIAAVQVARNERITLRDAIMFTKERCTSYLAAPVFPMVLIGILTLMLMVFGWIEWIPYFVGDLFAGLLWPVVILIGFIMTIVLVGLIGWPLMTATISTEGTDSFDALSRSYSYVYQAPWQYLWYSFLAVVYGAVLVFFIGFMASMMVFLGKWGVSSAVGLSSADPKTDREPSYLFYYAPRSFGWRDLLISSNRRFVEEKTVIAYDGRPVKRVEFKEEYEAALQPWEKMGAFLVSLWIYPLFLLVVGFGYSFFWSASTIIYFLMRHHVDDTEMDEVHVDEEELDDPFMRPAAAAAPPAAPAPAPGGKPGTVSLNVVDAPPAPPTAYTPPPPPPAPPAGLPPESPPPA